MTHLRIRLVIAPFLVIGGLWLHEFIQALPTAMFVIDNPIDNAIPFVPWTIWIYFSFFLFVGSTVFRVEDKLFWQFVASASLAATIAWTIILIVPITASRPDPALIESDLYRQIYTFVHAADPHHLSFPSLHVAVTWICNFLLWKRSGRGIRIALGLGISLSTLLTKQHLIADVIGGMLLAWFCVWVTGKYARLLPQSKPTSN
jgi:membrane-associated phospholipid phosphatase